MNSLAKGLKRMVTKVQWPKIFHLVYPGLPHLRFVWLPLLACPGFFATPAPKERDCPRRLYSRKRPVTLVESIRRPRRGWRCRSGGHSPGKPRWLRHGGEEKMGGEAVSSACHLLGIRIGEASHPEPSVIKITCSKRSHGHHHTTPAPPLHPGASPRRPFFSRKPRLPVAFFPQPCPVSRCPSRHGKEAQRWATKQGLKTDVGAQHGTSARPGTAHSMFAQTVFLLISCRTGPCCPRCHSALNNPVSQFMG